MKLLYFAWIRERIGLEEEDISVPDDVVTVADLVTWLGSRGERYAYALSEPRAIRVAVDQVHAKPTTALGDAREVALFPPMTGG
ncbi:molybdopterin converting factor subunit 1 [Bauldia sp.]|uniref:molybdopterin converting factor subunit 1 n=1 Tax=Bauldia sp. TaxID=2575872 RepID=UPI003BA9C16B